MIWPLSGFQLYGLYCNSDLDLCTVHVTRYVHNRHAWLTVARQMPLILPHHLLAYLHKKFGGQMPHAEQLRAFWKHFQTCTHESIRWPHCYEDDCIPIGLHGDDLRYTETGQMLLCVSLNFLLDEGQERYPLL